jgi:hypothetical protein
MKLPLYVCTGCGAPLDTDDPRWWRDPVHGADVHRHGGGLLCGHARLRRSRERQAALDDDAAAIAERATCIAVDTRRAILRRGLFGDDP